MGIQQARLLSRLSYQFKDVSLLDRALTHRSVGRENNERFEFLGDSLLNFIIAEALFAKFPNAREGDLSRLRATLVKGETLTSIAREFDLGESLNLGEGELKSGGHRRASILADAVEAIIGAIYLDSDFEQCRSVVVSWFASRLENITLENTDKDPKTRLQEYLQERKKALPVYKVLESRGEAHAQEFVVACKLDYIDTVCTASSSSKRAAEKQAAEKMLQHLLSEKKPS